MPIELREALSLMLEELESNRLEVMLVPQRRRTNECGMIRVAVSKNAKWYRDFCAQYPSGRFRRNAAPDTRIKRAQTERTLRRLLAGVPARGEYAHRILPLARRLAASLAIKAS